MCPRVIKRADILKGVMMTVKEILILTAKMLGEKQIVNLLTKQTCDDLQSVSEDKDMLLSCYNATTEELALEYLPLEFCEEFNGVTDNKIYFSSFSKKPLKIVSVCDLSGNKLPYKLINDYIYVERKSVKITYEYRPTMQNEEDEAVFSDNGIGPFTLCYGIASLYCLQKGRHSDAEGFFERYFSAIKSRIAEKRKIIIPARSWR